MLLTKLHKLNFHIVIVIVEIANNSINFVSNINRHHENIYPTKMNSEPEECPFHPQVIAKEFEWSESSRYVL